MSASSRDRRALERIAAAEPGALAELHDRYAGLLHAFAVRLTDGHAEVGPVLERTWGEVVRRAGEHDPARSSVAAWLAAIVRAQALATLKQQRARDGAVGASLVPARAPEGEDAPAPATGYAQRMLRREATAAVGSLGESQRRVVEAACLRGQALASIASEMGASEASVRAWLRHGLQRLHERMPIEELP